MLNLRLAKRLRNYYAAVCAIAVSGLMVVMVPTSGRAQTPIAVAPYTVTTFATAPNGLSAPDSITFSATNVFVGYGNGGAPDGSGGAISDIVEYDFSGHQVGQPITIVGHNDGLRYNPLTNELWGLQNEDANTTLAIINLKTGKQTIYSLVSPVTHTGPHGGGYDDIDFLNKSVFISASAPALSPDAAPAIASLKVTPKTATLRGILNGNASVTNVTTGDAVTLNLTDPDSMIVDPFGELVMTSQGDGELIIVQYPGLSCQKNFVVPLTSEAGPDTAETQLDDTVFANRSSGELLVADKGLNAVYEITAPYLTGYAYSAVSVFVPFNAANPTESFVGQTNLTTGFVTPIVNGMSDPGGMAFIPLGLSTKDMANYVKASVQIPVACPAS